MGTALLANSTVKLSFAWNAFYYWGVWAVCIIGIGICVRAALRSRHWARWTGTPVTARWSRRRAGPSSPRPTPPRRTTTCGGSHR
jgi:hypothetical protein